MLYRNNEMLLSELQGTYKHNVDKFRPRQSFLLAVYAFHNIHLGSENSTEVLKFFLLQGKIFHFNQVKSVDFRTRKAHIKICTIHRRVFYGATTNLHMKNVYYFIWYHSWRHGSSCYWRAVQCSKITKRNSYSILEFIERHMCVRACVGVAGRRSDKLCNLDCGNSGLESRQTPVYLSLTQVILHTLYSWILE